MYMSFYMHKVHIKLHVCRKRTASHMQDMVVLPHYHMLGIHMSKRKELEITITSPYMYM